jgi:hypothetical protein
MWFCFVTSKWIIKHWSPYENAWLFHIRWIFKHHSYILWALFVGSKIHGVGREELFNHFNKKDVEAYFNYSSLQEFSLNWVGAQCFVKGNWTQDKIHGSLTICIIKWVWTLISCSCMGMTLLIPLKCMWVFL